MSGGVNDEAFVYAPVFRRVIFLECVAIHWVSNHFQFCIMFCKGLSSYEAYQKFPEEVNRIQALQDEISGGTTAVLALIFQKKLFVANVGDSRALLCRETPEGSVSVEQVSIILAVVMIMVGPLGY